jgi:trigger factor
MDIRIDAQSPIASQVEVTLDEQEVAAGVERRLKQIGKTAKVQGFRPGKIPPKMLRQKYGRTARFEAVDRLVNDAMPKALDHEDLAGVIHVTQPELIAGVDDGPLVFRFVAERLPDVEPKGYEGVAVELKRVVIDDARIDERLTALQDTHTEILPVEDRDTVEATDIVIASYHGRGSADAEQIHAHDQQIDLADENLLDGFASGLVGAKKGEEATIALEIPEQFGLESLRGTTIEVGVTVSEIKAKRVPEIDDELAKESGEADSLDALKTKIRTELEAEAKKREENAAKRRLLTAIVAANDTELPPEYVRTQAEQEAIGRMRELMGQGIDPKQMGLDPRQLAAGLEGDVKSAILESLLLREIAKKEAVEVDDDAIEAWMSEQAEESGQPLPRIKAQFQAGEQRERLRIRLLFDRVLDFVWSKATITEVDALAEEAGDQAAATGDEAADD